MSLHNTKSNSILHTFNTSSADAIATLEQLLTIVMQQANPPKETALFADYPNPFNPETWIPYHLAKTTEVTVSIYSADGRLV